MLPDIASSISLSVGLGFSRSSTAALMICPDWAVTALRHVDLHPRTLQRMRKIGRKALDGRDALPFHSRQRRYARANGLTVEMHRAGAAKSHAAAKFCTG